MCNCYWSTGLNIVCKNNSDNGMPDINLGTSVGFQSKFNSRCCDYENYKWNRHNANGYSFNGYSAVVRVHSVYALPRCCCQILKRSDYILIGLEQWTMGMDVFHTSSRALREMCCSGLLQRLVEGLWHVTCVSVVSRTEWQNVTGCTANERHRPSDDHFAK